MLIQFDRKKKKEKKRLTKVQWHQDRDTVDGRIGISEVGSS